MEPLICVETKDAGEVSLTVATLGRAPTPAEGPPMGYR